MTFERLVYHIYLERKRFSDMWRKVRPEAWQKAGKLLIDGHDGERLKTLVGLATAEDDQAKAKIAANPPDTTQSTLSCRYCYELTRQARPVTKGLVDYHMLSMHGRAREPGDLAPLTELMTTFGKP
ncbi:unnamed protein product [Cyclocybe aegerita]|uniref:Uncharacterized protein n=1 Tax=Cyclocybe aegerita TaxID=1973307 RepID=A0A8S0W5M4_CYCAE|nr:unnamed protein product [Cyclocybe aegerita]